MDSEPKTPGSAVNLTDDAREALADLEQQYDIDVKYNVIVEAALLDYHESELGE